MQAKVIHEDSEGGLPGERTFALIVESPKFLRRKIDPESGLALIDIGASEGAIPGA